MTQFGFTPAALKEAADSDVATIAAPDENAKAAPALPASPSQADSTDGGMAAGTLASPGPAQGEAEPNAATTAEGSKPTKPGFFASLFSRSPENGDSASGASAQAEVIAATQAPKPDELADNTDEEAVADRTGTSGENADNAKPGFFASLFSPSSETDNAGPRKLIEPDDVAEVDATSNGDLDAPRSEETAPNTAAGETAGAKKPGFLMALFSPAEAPAKQNAVARSMEDKIDDAAEVKAEPAAVDQNAGAAPIRASFGDDVLPGVRDSEQLFEVVRKSNIDDISDVDLYEGEGVQVASAAGLARLAPHGLLKQRDDVDVACFKPELVRMLKTIERRFGKRIVVTSGYRSPAHNRRVRGARRSQHMYCAAADIQLAGVSKWELARFVRTLPGRGGVGTYCHTKSVHVDVGPERDWNWRCRR